MTDEIKKPCDCEYCEADDEGKARTIDYVIGGERSDLIAEPVTMVLSQYELGLIYIDMTDRYEGQVWAYENAGFPMGSSDWHRCRTAAARADQIRAILGADVAKAIYGKAQAARRERNEYHELEVAAAKGIVPEERSISNLEESFLLHIMAYLSLRNLDRDRPTFKAAEALGEAINKHRTDTEPQRHAVVW